jgi:hypothetical protein
MCTLHTLQLSTACNLQRVPDLVEAVQRGIVSAVAVLLLIAPVTSFLTYQIFKKIWKTRSDFSVGNSSSNH